MREIESGIGAAFMFMASARLPRALIPKCGGLTTWVIKAIGFACLGNLGILFTPPFLNALPALTNMRP